MDKEENWLLQDKYNGKASALFNKDVARLKKGEPLAYVIGWSDFLGCKIDLSKKPLIPRPETEYWVERAIEEIKAGFGRGQNRPLKILDIFSGSGCIGIALLKHIENASVVFAEKEKRFTAQIKINTALNNINKKRYKITQSDIFKKVVGKYDYIFANPPYISTLHKNKIQPSVLNYEPKTALFGGADGLFYIKKFLAQAPAFLNANGKIYMEFDSLQKKQLEKVLIASGYQNFQFFKDQHGRPRYVIINIK